MKEYLNIVLYVNSFLPQVGGREFVVYYLADSLMRLGHKVRVLGPSGWWRNRKYRFEYPVHRWPTLGGLYSEQVKLSHLFFDTLIWGCDVIHAHNTYPTGYIATRMKAFNRLPLVITPHGEDIHVIPEIGHGLRLNPVLSNKINKALQGAELLTAISTSVETSLLEAGGAQEKIRNIPNGVDIERFQQSSTVDIKNWLKLSTDKKLILTVGSYNRRRGYEDLIHSMPIILASEPNAFLIIVGRDNKRNLLPMVQELNLDDNIFFTGTINHPIIDNCNDDLLASIYLGSDVYVSAGMSEGAEGLSLALLDAMAAQLPIVATNISGNRDIIQDGVSGFLIPPSDPQQFADRIIKLLGNSEMRTRIGVAAKQVVKMHGWDEVARRYVDVYQEARDLCG